MQTNALLAWRRFYSCKKRVLQEASEKLQPKWSGPFVMIDKTRPGSFCFTDNEGRVLEYSWDAIQPSSFLHLSNFVNREDL
jgi:hypothetical protein